MPYFLFVTVALFLEWWSRQRRKFRKPTLKNSSILLSYYTEGRELMPIINQKLESGAGHIGLIARGDNGMFIDTVYLPFTTSLRLLAIPTLEASQLNPANGKSMMEPVVLEGDFPNYFKLYSNNGEQVLSRYILDPKAMAFVVDVCKKYSWELVNDELIFVTKSGIPIEEIDKFIAEIRPAIEISASTVDQLVKREYKHAFFAVFRCPICRELARDKKCPRGHGRLVTGGELAQLPRLIANIRPATQGDPNRLLHCPNCNQPMVKINYTKNTEIDSCINCPYRWLDNGELVSA